MASDKDRPSPGPGQGGGPSRRKRPVEPRPIELEATELRDETQPPDRTSHLARDVPAEKASAPQEPQDEAAAAEQATEGATAESGTSDETVDSEDSADSGGVPPQDTSADVPLAAPPRQSRFAAALFAAGVGGGLVALLLMFALGAAGIWPPAEDTALRAELAVTQARIAALEETEAEIPQAVDPVEIEQLAGRVTALEEADIEIPAAADPEAIEGLSARLQALEAQFEDGVESPVLTALEERVSALEAAAAEMAASEDVDEAVAEIGERVDELAGALSGLAEGIGPDPQIAERLSQVEAEFAEERGAREALVSRIESVEGRIGEAAAAGDRQLARAAAGTVMLSGLARVVESGRPYDSELAAIQSLIDDPQAIETLAANAETGLPTAAALAEAFSGRVTAILGARDDAQESPGFLSRITESASALVRVRPAGPMEGESRSAVVSRIEAALAVGNLDVAHEEWQALDPPAREASAQWASALAERRAADDELELLFAEVSAALGQRADGSD